MARTGRRARIFPGEFDHITDWRMDGEIRSREVNADVEWMTRMIGAIAVTIPSCWYLWPDSSHAEHSGGHGHDEHGEGEEGGEEEGGEEKAAEGGEQEEGGEEKSSEDDSKGGDEEKPSSDDGEEKKDDSEAQDDTSSKDDSKPNKNDSKQGQDSSAPDFDKTPADAPPTEEQETSPGGGGGKDDETVTKDGPKDRKVKKKPDSGQTIGFTKDEEGQDKKESVSSS